MGGTLGSSNCIADEEEVAPTGPPTKKAKGCTHGPEATACNKFCFTAVHKGEWELALWQDSKLMVCLSNFFSSERAGVLTRGSHKSKYSYAVWAPEGIWFYNVEGRSATDGHDQERKKLAMAERRIKRFGLKGMMFAFDLAFTNGSILNRCLAPKDLPAKDRHLLSKVSFMQRWAQEQFDSRKPLRKRMPAGMCIRQAAATNTSTHANAASAHVMQRTEHELVDMGDVTRAMGFRTKQAHEGPKKRKGIPHGKCHYVNCPTPAKSSQKRCQSCKGGTGAYYHLPCFFATHKCSFGRDHSG